MSPALGGAAIRGAEARSAHAMPLSLPTGILTASPVAQTSKYTPNLSSPPPHTHLFITSCLDESRSLPSGLPASGPHPFAHMAGGILLNPSPFTSLLCSQPSAGSHLTQSKAQSPHSDPEALGDVPFPSCLLAIPQMPGRPPPRATALAGSSARGGLPQISMRLTPTLCHRCRKAFPDHLPPLPLTLQYSASWQCPGAPV